MLFIYKKGAVAFLSAHVERPNNLYLAGGYNFYLIFLLDESFSIVKIGVSACKNIRCSCFLGEKNTRIFIRLEAASFRRYNRFVEKSNRTLENSVKSRANYRIFFENLKTTAAIFFFNFVNTKNLCKVLNKTYIEF